MCHSPPAAWAALDQATLVAAGPDSIAFVDNFLTASIKSVPVGGGTEAFVTDVRGWVIALVTVLRTDSGLEVTAAPSLGERLRDHLEHYHIREAVELTDATNAIRALLVTGPEAAHVLNRLATPTIPLPTTPLGHAILPIAGHDVRVVFVTGQGADGFQIRGDTAAVEAIAQALGAHGVPRASDADLESARIAAGYPAALDIPEKTLPQELGRDARAISFTKGCYLGQETVARLDALGHVNRRLVILAIESGDLPACPIAIHDGIDQVGLLTSCCHDARRGMVVGLGIVHTKAIEAARLVIGGSLARVVAVPPSTLD